jgi:hypothetical protein
MKEYIKLTSQKDITGNDNVHSIIFYKDSEYEIYHRVNDKPAILEEMSIESLFEYWTNVEYWINGEFIKRYERIY